MLTCGKLAMLQLHYEARAGSDSCSRFHSLRHGGASYVTVQSTVGKGYRAMDAYCWHHRSLSHKVRIRNWVVRARHQKSGTLRNTSMGMDAIASFDALPGSWDSLL